MFVLVFIREISFKVKSGPKEARRFNCLGGIFPLGNMGVCWVFALICTENV